MEYFFNLGLKVIEWFKDIAKFFTIPMNSPEFLEFVSPKTGVAFLDTQIFAMKLPLYGLLQLAGNVSFLEFVLSAGLSFFFTYTLIKWLLPTS